MRTIECKITLFAIFFIVALEQTFCFCEIFCSEFLLNSHQTLYEGLIFFVHLVISTFHRPRNDERCTSIVNQHGVYLVDNCVIVLALHEICGTHRHIVAEIVESELIVRTKSDVAIVCTTTRFTVGLVFVNAIHAQTVELIERSHPFGVTFRQIVIDSHHVHTASRECAEEHGTSCHQSFTLTGSHLSNFTLCEHHPTEELHIIVHHFPLEVVTSCKPVVLVNRFGTIFRDCHKVASHRQFAVIIVSRNFDCFVLSEAARSFFHDSESLRKSFFKRNIHTLEHFFLEFIDFVEKKFAIFDGSFLDFSTNFSDLRIEVVARTLNVMFQFFSLCA